MYDVVKKRNVEKIVDLYDLMKFYLFFCLLMFGMRCSSIVSVFMNI